MNVVVCVKQIPDPATPGKLDPSTHTLVRTDKLILDLALTPNVESALSVRFRVFGISTIGIFARTRRTVSVEKEYHDYHLLDR